MSEVRTFSVADVITLFGMVSAAILGGIGAAMGWFKSSNKKRDERTDGLETRMTNYEAVRATQAIQLAVIETCQQNINDKLEQMNDNIERSAEKGAHSVNEQIAQLTNAVQQVAENQRRERR